MKKQTKQSAERKALMKEKLAARDAVNRHNTATSTAVVAAAAKAATKAVVEAVRQEAVPDSRLRKSDLAAVAAGAVQALTVETKKHKGTSETRSETARRMILAGKTDAQVLDALIELHGLDPAKHKYYPRWYRNELVRDGKLSKTRAKMNA